METVSRLYRRVRPQAKYQRSLDQIQRTKDAGCRTKSGFMVGLGEEPEEVYEILRHLAEHGCDVVTIGQYLQPTKMHLPVHEFIHQDLFDHYRDFGLQLGLKYVEVGHSFALAITQRDTCRRQTRTRYSSFLPA